MRGWPVTEVMQQLRLPKSSVDLEGKFFLFECIQSLIYYETFYSCLLESGNGTVKSPYTLFQHGYTRNNYCIGGLSTGSVKKNFTMENNLKSYKSNFADRDPDLFTSFTENVFFN
jgi:hypothetical protein